jgi:hypothetical protein
MKTRTCLITAAACLLLAASLRAMTRQWSVPAGMNVTGILADRKGGCAFTCVESNGVHFVVWVDRKGVVKFEKALSTGVGAVLVTCHKNDLVYMRAGAGYGVFVQVHKQGEQSLSESGKLIAAIKQTLVSDKKGFFAAVIDTNQSPTRAEVVRYSRK